MTAHPTGAMPTVFSPDSQFVYDFGHQPVDYAVSTAGTIVGIIVG